MAKMEPVKVNVNFLYHLETSENHRFFMFLGGTKGNIDPKRVTQQQYRREPKLRQFDVVSLKR